MSGAENNFEKLLGKNGELVEERKKQVLAGALEIVQRYYKETPNKMEVVAALFGKKLWEEFQVVSDDGLDCICRFDENNILEIKDMCGRWIQVYSVLNDLLTGTVKIVEDEK
jgi:hypothetical protein